MKLKLENCMIAVLIILGSFAQQACPQAPVTPALDRPAAKQTPSRRTKMNGELPYKPVDEATAYKELKSYIIEWKYGRKSVPTLLDPVHVDKFLREKLDRSLHANAFERARRVVDYYDLITVIDHLEKMLDRGEKESRQFMQSVQLIMTLAQVGDDLTRAKAATYFQFLVGHKLASEHYEQMAMAVDAFGPELKVDGLQKKMSAEFDQLKAKGKTDRASDDEAEYIDGVLHNDLPKALSERDQRQRILSAQDVAKRIDETCRLYMGWSESEDLELRWWAARQLRAISREGKNEQIIASLKNVAKEIEASDLSDEEKFAYRLRSARAVRFFGGTLSTKERFVLSQPDEGQIDVLFRETGQEAN